MDAFYIIATPTIALGYKLAMEQPIPDDRDNAVRSHNGLLGRFQKGLKLRPIFKGWPRNPVLKRSVNTRLDMRIYNMNIAKFGVLVG